MNSKNDYLEVGNKCRLKSMVFRLYDLNIHNLGIIATAQQLKEKNTYL